MFFQRMNSRIDIGQKRGGAVAVGNHDPLQALSEGVAMLVNPAGLTDAEVRASLSQMAQTITMQHQAITPKSTRRMFKRSMADRL